MSTENYNALYKVDLFPYNQWYSNPLSEDNIILAHRAGIYPEKTITVVTNLQDEVCYPFIQNSCMQILPKNSCYLANKEYPIAP